MPQLDTSTWLTVIMSTLTSLFIIFQLKISSHSYFLHPQTHPFKTLERKMPWEKKWTKTCLPLSPHPHL